MHYDARDQHARFADADHERRAWIETCRTVNAHEQAVYDALGPLEGRVLEVGAGEGLLPRFRADLDPSRYVATDLHPSRAAASQAALPGSHGIAADISALPFADGAFDTVVCRDVLHHLPLDTRLAAIRAIHRVLKGGGRAVFIEPNAARSPIVALFSAAIATERMALRFSAAALSGWLHEAFSEVTLDHIEPSMLYRLVLHHRFGQPALERNPLVAGGLRAWERVSAALPARHWTYLRAIAHKR